MSTTVGFVGLGRMGLNMAAHLVEEEFTVVGYNRSEEPRLKAQELGVSACFDNFEDFTAALPERKIIWLLVPRAVVDEVLDALLPLLSENDIVVDGGNSFYKDSILRHKRATDMGIKFLDSGTSGGIEGARGGASIMVGGDPAVFAEVEPIVKSLAAPDGYALVGGPGAGHFVKMIHNGIEYGMMGAIAEGMNVINEHKDVFPIDMAAVLKPYEHESIITSKLVSWMVRAYDEGQIEAISGEVPYGETEEEMEHIVEIGDVKVLEASLQQRKDTRVNPSYIGKLVAAMRNQFGGHKTIAKNE